MVTYSLAVFLLLVLGAAATGIFFKPGEWYSSLKKPRWTPPNWAFPVVWSLLYLMIAVAGWLVYEALGFGLLLGLWAVQLILNMIWSWIFFGRRAMGLGFIDILGLFFVIAGFIWVAREAVPLAALLFSPYLVWVGLALALNFKIWQLNR